MAVSTTPTITLGVDVGATSVKGAAVGADGRVLARCVVSTPSAGTSAEIVDAIVAGVTMLREAADDADAVGLAAAGWIGADRRSVVYSANFSSWRSEPLVERIEQRTGLPVVLENDANSRRVGGVPVRCGGGDHVDGRRHAG